MTERKRTKRQERSYAEMLAHIAELEDWNRRDRLKRAAIPRDWYEIAAKTPTKPRKVRLTAGYDADVARWYRSLGQGYQARMNAVLRAYMLAVVSKEIEVAGDRDWKGDPI
ncbi:BrnA antitoxin family protein [Amaricoccus sp.]|uniref:BrnA antitoxin family protein n=1 Tax=Amaricoccus sp. TaxID=1872485 RepID=UPI00261A59CD|nr:BrnA antitoxin family protein [uncultured Amaricoccus sp.]